MISQSAEYALRAVVTLATHPDVRMSTASIADATKVPAGYLPKVLQALARGGLVASIPGRIGGFALVRSPGSISVLDVVNAFRAATGAALPYRIASRRPGDAPAVYADPSRARAELGWKAELALEAMCADAWRWQQANPRGY